MSADTQFMIFDFKSIVAESHNSYGAPLTLKLATKHGDFEMVIYTDNQDLTDRLEVAINNAVAKPAPVAIGEHERAAYSAAAYHYNGGSR